MGGWSVGEVPFHGVRPVNNKVAGTAPDGTLNAIGKAAEYGGMAVGTYQAVSAAWTALEPVMAGLSAAGFL